LRITPRHLAYLKVSEGCDRNCTFCAIPFMRGKHVTKPIEMVVAEARELARDGVRELILVAQDMTYYGVDLYGRPRLSDLLEELEQVEGIDWLRILYCYPQFFTDELYDVLGGSRKIIPYLDMPLQHINDRLLKQMNRRHTKEESEAIISRLRATISGLVLRTTFIVGFPGETEAEFDELVNFVTATKFERLGVFPYSFEGDTPAAKLPGHLPEAVALERRDRLMAAQQPIAFAFNQSLVGKTLDVLIDAPAPEGRHLWLGRSYADAPDVDGVTWVRGSELATGDIVSCEIVASKEYDLIGRPVSPANSVRRRARPKPRRRPPPGRLAIIDHS
jgi:ribosomal protein S12 methylthiotransferase